MVQREPPALVGAHQGEGRARRNLADAERRSKSLGEVRLARPEVACEQQDVALFERRRQKRGEALRLLDRRACVADAHGTDPSS